MKSFFALLALISMVGHTGTPDNIIGDVMPNPYSIDCPVLIKENSVTICAKFSYTDEFGQLDEAIRVYKLGTVRLVGKWEKSGQLGPDGKDEIFVISYVSKE